MGVFISFTTGRAKLDDPVTVHQTVYEGLKQILRDRATREPDYEPISFQLTTLGRDLLNPARLRSALYQANAIIALISPAYLTNRWLTRELDAFIALEQAEKTRLVIPVFYDGTPVAALEGVTPRNRPVVAPENTPEAIYAAIEPLLTATIEANQAPAIFLSHSAQDSHVGELLRRLLVKALQLKDDEIRFTSDSGDGQLTVGKAPAGALLREIYQAPALVGLITPASRQSAWVMFELGARWGTGKESLVVLANNAMTSLIPAPLRNEIAARCDNLTSMQRLVGRLAEDTGRIPLPSNQYTRELNELIQAVASLPAAV